MNFFVAVMDVQGMKKFYKWYTVELPPCNPHKNEGSSQFAGISVRG